jgi:hypothetical protein
MACPRLHPFGLSLPFDRLRMFGNARQSPFGLSLSKPARRWGGHFDRLSANGGMNAAVNAEVNGWEGAVAAAVPWSACA